MDETSDSKPDAGVQSSSWDSPPWKAAKTGAKWGCVAGFVVAQWYMSRWMFHGFYLGNDALVFAVCIGGGTAIGAGIGWLTAQKIGEDDDVPPPSFPLEPYS
jgi:hypothetical protein